MTIEDLREHGVLLPEEEWGAHELETTVPERPVAGALLAAAVLWAVAYVGDGGTLTWIAVSAFVVLLYAVTWVCDRAILRQRENFRRERRAFRERSGGDGGRSGDG